MLSESNDSTIIWYAPVKPGQYKVWVRVNDAFNARVQKSINLTVKTPSEIDSTEVKYKPPKGVRIPPQPRRPGGRQTGPPGGTGK
jgi:hypothetical protein